MQNYSERNWTVPSIVKLTIKGYKFFQVFVHRMEIHFSIILYASFDKQWNLNVRIIYFVRADVHGK